MNSGLKARAPGSAIAGPGKANHYHGDLWPRNQVKERCKVATAPTETRDFTSSHSLAMQLLCVKGGKQAPVRQQQQETGFFCLDAFGKAAAVHRICGRGRYIRAGTGYPSNQRKEFFAVSGVNMAVSFCPFWKPRAQVGTSPRVLVSNIPTQGHTRQGCSKVDIRTAANTTGMHICF